MPTASTDVLADLHVTLEAEAGCTVRRGRLWSHVAPPGATAPAHGWKFHLSSCLEDYPAVASTVIPVLVAERCLFKFAHSLEALAELNDGITSPATVGKAITVYPDQDRVRRLGGLLVELLRGRSGPRVLSDRRLEESAPVYYRYGPFRTEERRDGLGRPSNTLRGPDGEEFDGSATLEYRQPPWVTDPFTSGTSEGRPPSSRVDLLGGRYRVTSGVRESARGSVYRAVDRATGRSVIVKQARAFVAEGLDRADARTRLRNERRVLVAADGVVGVPRFVDHFRHANDEFLVITDQGPRNLTEEILRGGHFVPGHGRRSLDRLAHCLAGILARLHRRGILVRDIGAKNVVVADPGADSPYSLVDFGFSYHDGFGLYGYTPQYSPPRQIRGEEPREADDLYALGMTLIEAATGLIPLALEQEPELPRVRGLETVRVLYGPRPDGVVGAAIDLTSADPAVAERPFHWLAEGRERTYLATTRPASPPVVTPAVLEDLTGGVLDVVCGQIDQLLAEEDAPETSVRNNPSIFTGTAGIGLELLRHLDSSGVRERVTGLVAATRAVIDHDDVPPGLVIGRTGADLFLAQARDADIDGTGGLVLDRPLAVRIGEGLDLFEGAAGIGLAHAWFHEHTGDPRELEVIEHCSWLVVASHGLDGFGLAHGRAGILAFLLAAGTTEARAEAARRVPVLVERARRLMDRARRPGNDSLGMVSWCNGLTGVARTLLLAGARLERPDLTALAQRAGDVCAMWVPRLAVVGQCCGAAGIGDLLIDLARLPGGERHREQAIAVVRQLLLRRGGDLTRPVFVDPDPHAGSASWGNGLAGILGFLRRLRDDGDDSDRILPLL